MTKQREGARGLLINPDAARYLLGDRSQASLAKTAKVTPANLSKILAGESGCNADTAGRIADALSCPPGVLFPELTIFRAELRVFAARGAA